MTLAQGLLAEGQKRKYVPRYSPCYQKKRKHSDVSGRKKFHVSSCTETPSFYPSSYQTMSLARKQNYRIQYTGNLWLFCLPLLLKSLLPLKQLVCFSLFHLCHHLSLCSRPSLTRLQLTTQFGTWHPLVPFASSVDTLPPHGCWLFLNQHVPVAGFKTHPLPLSASPGESVHFSEGYAESTLYLLSLPIPHPPTQPCFLISVLTVSRCSLLLPGSQHFPSWNPFPPIHTLILH